MSCIGSGFKSLSIKLKVKRGRGGCRVVVWVAKSEGGLSFTTETRRAGRLHGGLHHSTLCASSTLSRVSVVKLNSPDSCISH